MKIGLNTPPNQHFRLNRYGQRSPPCLTAGEPDGRYEGPPTEENLVERLIQAEFFAKLKPASGERLRVVASHAPF